MTAPETAPGRGLLLGKLMATVRAEFRVEVFVPDPDEPVLGVKECLVGGCDRSVSQNGLCSAHGHRWLRVGRPDVNEFAADPGPVLTGRSQPGRCTVTGCEYAVNAHGLCMRHHLRWKRAGRPDPVAWAAAAPATTGERPRCQLPFCTLWLENDKWPFCRSHTTRWRQLGSPDIDDFVEHCLLRGRARVDFRGLAPQLALEIGYAMQCRRDEQTIMTPPSMIGWAIRQAVRAGVGSLLDLSPEQWRERAATGAAWASATAFLLFARDMLETLRDGSGWEIEYPRDVWRLHKLPGLTTNPSKPRPRNNLRFDRIAQPWLRALVKRWIRLRLA
ncbi:MAG: hypothetical protein ACRDRL_15990, partial [Sciscionella sp.]